MTVIDRPIAETESRKPGLGLFFAMTFALTWGIASLFMFAPDLVGQAGLSNPFFILAVWAPAFAGIFVVWRRLGVSGLRGFFERLTMLRMPIWGWLFIFVGMPVIVYAGAILGGTAGDAPVFSPGYTVIGALAGSFFLAGTVEEIGWRGVALPLLQRRFTPLVAGLVLGFVWALWHLPAFALSGTVQSAWALGPYVVGLLSLSVIMTWLFNVSRGSILVAWIFHFQAMNPIFPDSLPWDSLFYALAAVIVVILNRRSMLTKAESFVSLQRSVTDDQGLQIEV